MMKKIVLLSLLLLITILSYSQKLKLYDLTCEHQVNPIGIETQQPRFSWKIKTSSRNTMQIAYSIRVSETASFSKNIIWESGKINSSESNLVSLFLDNSAKD